MNLAPGLYWVLEKGIATQWEPARWDGARWTFIGDGEQYSPTAADDFIEQVGAAIVPPSVITHAPMTNYAPGSLEYEQQQQDTR